jgi:hypothetical protein
VQHRRRGAVAVACTLMLVVSLTLAAACGKAPDITGTYRLTSLTLPPLSYVTLTVKAGGTFEITGTRVPAHFPVTVPGSWTQQGDAVTLTPKGTLGAAIGPQSGKYQSGNLVFGHYTFVRL